MKRRILLSLLTLGVVGALAAGATRAIFSDTETSTGNTFTAGAIDLGIDNHSYYNGNECADNGPEADPRYTWVGTEDYPEPGTPCTMTWRVDYDLSHDAEGNPEIHKFFDYSDLKPGDWGEDTISLHVDNNDAYLCADVTLTSNDDNGITEPEADSGDDSDGPGAGELGNEVTFYWWADDGDNVYEQGEQLLPGGPLGALAVGETATVHLADSVTNIWNEGGAPGPLPGGDVVFIGKAWCFGDATMQPYPQDGEGNPDGGPSERPVQCNGASLGNDTQTDSMTADITFRAVQARHNDQFVCEPPRPGTTLTIQKEVINDGGGQETADSWTYSISDVGEATLGIAYNVDSNTLYHVSESGPGGYELTYGGACDENGDVTLNEGDHLICTLTNTYAPEPGELTVTKEVINDDGGNKTVPDFTLLVDGSPVTSGVPVQVSAGPHVVSESGSAGYAASFSIDCDGDGNVNVPSGGSADCTITNNDIKPVITLKKVVVGGAAQPTDFAMRVDGFLVPHNSSRSVTANADHTITEDAHAGYHFTSITGTGCPATIGGTVNLQPGESITCTITNTAD